MLRNVSGQKWRVYAWDSTTGAAKTGDAANISGRIRIDDGSNAATNDTNPTEADATNEPGFYDFDMTQAESNGAKLSLSAKSSTSNIRVLAVPPVVYTVPQYDSLLVIDSSGRIDLGKWLGTAPLALTSQQVQAVVPSTQKVDIETIKGQAVAAAAGVTFPASVGTSTLTQSQVTGGAYSVQSSSCVLGDARVANLDAAVSSRGTSTLTQAQVTGGAYSVQSASCVLGDARMANLDALVSSRSTYAGGDTSGTTTLLTRVTAAVALAGSAPTWYTAPVDVSANVTAIKAKTDNLPSSPAAVGSAMTLTAAYDAAKTAAQAGDAMAITGGSGSALVSAVSAVIISDHGGGSYVRNTEPVDVSSNVSAIKAKTDQLTFTVANKVDATADVALSAGDIDDIADAVVAGIGDATDPLLNDPSTYTSPSVGYDIHASRVKLDAIGSGAVTVVSAVSADGTVLRLLRGDDYNTGDGRAIEFSSDSWPSLASATVRLVLPGVTITGAVVGTGSESTKTVRFQPTATQTALARSGAYRVAATQADSNQITLVKDGQVIVE